MLKKLKIKRPLIFSSFVCLFSGAMASNVKKEEIFRSAVLPKNLSFKVDESVIKTTASARDFIIYCYRVKCPPEGVTVKEIEEGVEIKSDKGITKVNYEIEIPEGKPLESLCIEVGSFEADFEYSPFNVLRIKSGLARGRVQEFFGNLSLDAGALKIFSVSHKGYVADSFSSSLFLEARFGKGQFSLELPLDSDVISSVSFPSSSAAIFRNHFLSSPHPRIFVNGSFASGLFEIKKKI